MNLIKMLSTKSSGLWWVFRCPYIIAIKAALCAENYVGRVSITTFCENQEENIQSKSSK